MDLDGPILDKIKISFFEDVNFSVYPFSLDLIKNLQDIILPTQVTFFVGENGTGKSTLLESIAIRAGFGKEGGSKNINFNTADKELYSNIEKLASCMTLSWRKKVKDGYFFRAESFFNLATHIDTIDGGFSDYGGKSLHEQSHGESFLSFFKNRLGGGGLYIFDEPEAALSPQRQLTFLSTMHELCKNPETQFIIATHSPVLLAYPNATIYSFDNHLLETIEYKNTKHYEITKDFLNNPEYYLKRLLES